MVRDTWAVAHAYMQYSGCRERMEGRAYNKIMANRTGEVRSRARSKERKYGERASGWRGAGRTGERWERGKRSIEQLEGMVLNRRGEYLTTKEKRNDEANDGCKTWGQSGCGNMPMRIST